jgi:ribosome-interacting GTPase 1
LLVVDPSDPASPEAVAFVRDRLGEKKIALSSSWPADAQPVDAGDDEDPFQVRLPTLLVANKAELSAGAADLDALIELADIDFPKIGVSVEVNSGLDQIAEFLFEHLGIVRVYTKLPGKPPEHDKPFTVRQGATVLDVATLVHRDLAGSLRYARAWGKQVYDGQQVGPEHPVVDGDIIELHMR